LAFPNSHLAVGILVKFQTSMDSLSNSRWKYLSLVLLVIMYIVESRFAVNVHKIQYHCVINSDHASDITVSNVVTDVMLTRHS
jgi:hypothetical protein